MTEDMLIDELRQAAAPPMPKGFTPGIVYSGRQPSEITTPWMDHELATEEDFREAVLKMGVPLSEHLTLELVEAKFNQAAWHRDQDGIGAKHTAYTAPMWLYRFKVVQRSARADADIAVLMKDARKAAKAREPRSTGAGAMIINLADFQTGKTDEGGGTPELLEKSERALIQVLAQVKRQKPAQVILVDNGDSTEGFESSPGADRTNDLQQTEQIRVWRRLLWRWITALAKTGIPMTVISVPSNHCRVRRGKQNMADPSDDWGLEVLAQVADMAEVNPEAFGHVSFVVPRKHEEHVTVTLACGKVISFAHGHQVTRPAMLTEWAKRQGRREIGQSDIVVVGHFHHLRVEAYGDGQTLFCCPTMDPGSSWFTPRSGERSRPGVLTFVVDEDGWRDIFVAWQ